MKMLLETVGDIVFVYLSRGLRTEKELNSVHGQTALYGPYKKIKKRLAIPL